MAGEMGMVAAGQSELVATWEAYIAKRQAFLDAPTDARARIAIDAYTAFTRHYLSESEQARAPELVDNIERNYARILGHPVPPAEAQERAA